MEFGEKIKVFGKNKFGSLSKFAAALGMYQPDLSNYISGKTKPGKDFYVKMLKFGCDLNYLLEEEDHPIVVNDSFKEYKGGDIKNTINSTTKEAEEMGMTLSAGQMNGNINYGDTLVRELYLQISRLEEENKNCHQQIKNLTEIIKTMAAKGG